MTKFEQLLTADCAALVNLIRMEGPPGAHVDAARALQRLTEWSVARERSLNRLPPTGTDPLAGVSKAGFSTNLWRAYPKLTIGGKCSLHVRKDHPLRAPARAAIVRVLQQFDKRAQFGPRQKLDIGLEKISSPAGWALYEPALEWALNAN